MSFETRLVTGGFGEQILDRFLRQKGWIPYYPIEGVAHPFDRLVASADKKRICIVEVKTKWRREAYPDTGINRRHYDDYQHITIAYALPLFLAFVDAKVGKMYGNWWSELLKSQEPERSARFAGCASYPWEQRGIVYFQLSAMKTLAVLPEDERQKLLQMRSTNWTAIDDDEQKGA